MESYSTAVNLEKDLDEIPALDSSKMRLFQILEDENCDIRDVERIIQTDAAMSAKVIKLANSAFFRHAKQIAGIHDAVLTIGFDMVKCITLSMAVMRTFGNASRVSKELWRHAYAVALISFDCGRDKQERDTLFSGGLFHDLGRMVLLYKRPDLYIPLMEVKGSWPEQDIEQEIFQLDHTTIGERVADHWQFPAQVCDIIRHHHAPASRSSAIIHLANQVVHEQLRNIPIDISPCLDRVEEFLGEDYKNLVNSMVSRYKQNSPTIGNLM